MFRNKREMYRQILLLLITLCLFNSFAEAQKKKTSQIVRKTLPAPKKVINYIQDKDEYAVYEAVLKNSFQDKAGKTIVLNKELTGCGSVIDRDVQQVISRDVLDELFRDCYGKKNGNFELVAGQFPADDKIVLVSESEVEKFFSPNCNLIWQRFYKKYPNSTGNASFSRIGFNIDRSYAVVNFNNQSACQAGGGRIVFLQKENDVWQVKKFQMTWGSVN